MRWGKKFSFLEESRNRGRVTAPPHQNELVEMILAFGEVPPRMPH